VALVERLGVFEWTVEYGKPACEVD